jgi:hypothetical protein
MIPSGAILWPFGKAEGRGLAMNPSKKIRDFFISNPFLLKLNEPGH